MIIASSFNTSSRVESWLADLSEPRCKSLTHSPSRSSTAPTCYNGQETAHSTQIEKPSQANELPTPSATGSTGSPRSDMNDKVADDLSPRFATRGAGEGTFNAITSGKFDFETPRALHSATALPTTTVRLPPPIYPGTPILGSPSRKRRRTKSTPSSPTQSHTSSVSGKVIPDDSISQHSAQGFIIREEQSSTQSGFTTILSEASSSKPNEYAIENLEYLNPPVDLMEIETWLRRTPADGSLRCLPPTVQHLYNIIGRATRDRAAIPASIRPRLEARLTTFGQGKFLPGDGDYQPAASGTEWHDVELWNTVTKMREAQLAGDVSNESTAVQEIIVPLLKTVLFDRSSFAMSQLPVKLLNLQTSAIKPQRWIPRSIVHPSSRSTGRLIDLALSLPIVLPPHRSLNLATQCASSGVVSLNQMNAPNQYQALFTYIEAKAFNGKDPRSQLSVWAAAGHLKTVAHGWDTTIPRVGITVTGAHWALWLVFWHEESKRLAVLGPWSIGSTTDEVAIFRLIHVLRAIVGWGVKEFASLFEQGVLEMLD